MRIVPRSRAEVLGSAITIAGVVLLLFAYITQLEINEIGATDDPILQNRLSTLDDQRDTALVASIGTIILGLLALALLGEPSISIAVSADQMIAGAKIGSEIASALSLTGNSSYLPSHHGLNKERLFLSASGSVPAMPLALSDDQTLSPGKDGSTPGIILEPIGLGLLNRLELELGTKLEGVGLEAAEGDLQILKHGLGIMRDFHFKERDGKTILRVEYSGLLKACRTVRKEKPDTCRQVQCVGCSCLLSGAARSTQKVVSVESVDNSTDVVEFTLQMRDW